MTNAELDVRGPGDPRLAALATSPLPAWLWSADGTTVLWANPAGARLFGAANSTRLADRIFGPADPHRRQVAQLARRLVPDGAIRLERLRGFGATLGALVTCGCMRIDFADGSEGVLIAAAEPVGRAMPLVERLQRLVEDVDAPVSAFTREGLFVAASRPAADAGLHNLADAGLEEARQLALKDGRADTVFGDSHVTLLRVGSRADIGLLAVIVPADKTSPHDDASEDDALSEDKALRSPEFFNDPPSADTMSPEISPVVTKSCHAEPAVHVPDKDSPDTDLPDTDLPDTDLAAISPSATSQPTSLETPVDTPQDAPEEARQTPPNVVPFRPLGETRPPILTPVEDNAFNELARQLSARLEGDADAQEVTGPSIAAQAPIALPLEPEIREAAATPIWLAEPQPAPRGQSKRDRALLDLLPTGILIYRLDRLLYANRVFLDHIGYPNLHALEQAGGVDALYVEAGVSSASSTSDTGTPVRISTSDATSEAASTPAIDARLHTISWDDEAALALIFIDDGAEHAGMGHAAAPISLPAIPLLPVAAAAVPEPSAVGNANAEELAAILDTTADGILMFDAQGNINSCNRSAEALFGFDGAEFVQRNLVTLFAPESQSVVNHYLGSLNGTGVASLLEHGREVSGCIRGGGLIPLSMTMGRTQAHGPNFFAVFRDLSQLKKSENELRETRRLAESAADAKADLLARISHEIRAPLSAIIGFAEVMIGQRFGSLGNDRYVEYMKDVRTSGERVIAVIDELTDLSRIETGRLDLAFTSQNLNELVESCVALMQPQANRDRIIIRTSLAQMLPPVVADGPALRQITMNLIGNSIHLANAGGQVIVSTALTDFGEVALRIRDTGQGLNDNEVAAAMEPFRSQVPSDRSPEGAVSLSLTKALVEANRAQFNIKTGTRSGTLVEVVFSPTTARA